MPKKLTTEQQTYIIQSLACFMAPSEIIEAVREEFKVTITHANVRDYNPSNNEQLAEKWKALYEETRRAYLKEVASIGVFHRTYRLHQIQKLYHQAGKNIILKKELLEQAAKEVGGLFTNKRTFELEARDALAAMIGVSPDQLPLPENKGVH